MTEEEQEEQKVALNEKLSKLGFPSYQIKPGIDDLPMLYISTRLICGVGHALALGDEALSSLILETLTFWEETVPQAQKSVEPAPIQAQEPVQDAKAAMNEDEAVETPEPISVEETEEANANTSES